MIYRVVYRFWEPITCINTLTGGQAWGYHVPDSVISDDPPVRSFVRACVRTYPNLNKQVGFSYPARPNDIVFESLSISVATGETLALVGPSGGGKSTITKVY